MTVAVHEDHDSPPCRKHLNTALALVAFHDPCRATLNSPMLLRSTAALEPRGRIFHAAQRPRLHTAAGGFQVHLRAQARTAVAAAVCRLSIV